MGAARKIVLDVVLALVLILAGAFIAGIVKMQNPDCLTCGANVGATFSWAAILALQPVLWVTGLRKRTRFTVWLVAVGLGGVAYMTIERIAASLFLSGAVSSGLSLGLAANSTFDLVAGGASVAGVLYAKRSHSIVGKAESKSEDEG